MTEDELVQKYIGLVKWTAARHAPQRDYEDAVQDGLLGVVLAHRKFDPALGGDWHDLFVCLAIKRSIIDADRLRSGRRRRPPSVSIEAAIVDSDGEPLRVVDTLEARDTADGPVVADDLERWLRAIPLDPTDRRVLDRMLDGMLMQDIAALEGVTPSRISQRVHQIRERLTRALN